MAPVKRWRLLASPWFTGAVFVLAVNDQVLKRRFPGPVTGKLSDFAGVAMVAIAIGTVLSARAACGATAVAFTALKTSHEVALAFAPILGGVTLTDHTDLIALAVLVPTYRWLRTRRGDPAVADIGRLLLLPLVMFAMVGTVTADSCERDTGIVGFRQGDNGALEAIGIVTTYQLQERSFPSVESSSADGLHWKASSDNREIPPFHGRSVGVHHRRPLLSRCRS
jgi:hypothetical protein